MLLPAAVAGVACRRRSAAWCVPVAVAHLPALLLLCSPSHSVSVQKSVFSGSTGRAKQITDEKAMMLVARLSTPALNYQNTHG